MKKVQCDASIRIEDVKGLFCCTLKENHTNPFHRFEVKWHDLESRTGNLNNGKYKTKKT